jgi:hypothetical protein
MAKRVHVFGEREGFAGGGAVLDGGVSVRGLVEGGGLPDDRLDPVGGGLGQRPGGEGR